MDMTPLLPPGERAREALIHEGRARTQIGAPQRQMGVGQVGEAERHCYSLRFEFATSIQPIASLNNGKHSRQTHQYSGPCSKSEQVV